MMQTKNEMLESRTEAVSRDALVRAALQEITQTYREASLSNVARAYGVSLAYVSECVCAQTGTTYKELLQRHRMEPAARLLRRSDHPADHCPGGLREHQLFLPPVPRALRPEPP